MDAFHGEKSAQAAGLAGRGTGCHVRRMKAFFLVLGSWLALLAGAVAADEAAKSDEEKTVRWNVTAECRW